MGNPGRPKTDADRLVKRKIQESIINMSGKGYPLDYIASFHNLTKGRIVQILKKETERKRKEEEDRNEVNKLNK
jgi:hypothetical protein